MQWPVCVSVCVCACVCVCLGVFLMVTWPIFKRRGRKVDHYKGRGCTVDFTAASTDRWGLGSGARIITLSGNSPGPICLLILNFSLCYRWKSHRLCHHLEGIQPRYLNNEALCIHLLLPGRRHNVGAPASDWLDGGGGGASPPWAAQPAAAKWGDVQDCW